MTPEQKATLDAVRRWLTIRKKEGDAQMSADIWHSALLERLLAGKEPLPQPPPTEFSYPAYHLIETGEGTALPPHEYAIFPGRLVINQSSQWEIVERHDDGSYLVRCSTNDQLFDVLPPPEPVEDEAHALWTLRRREDASNG